jgi:hypothetical protein
MRTDEVVYDIEQQLFDLRTEIEEITVIVRELRRRDAAAGYDRAAARLAAAQAQVQQLAGAPRKPLGMPEP